MSRDDCRIRPSTELRPFQDAPGRPDLLGLAVQDLVRLASRPELYEILRVLVDRPDNAARFLVVGSTSPELVKDTSESLAGRVGFVDLSGFTLGEVGADERDRWEPRGLSFVADSTNTTLTCSTTDDQRYHFVDIDHVSVVAQCRREARYSHPSNRGYGVLHAENRTPLNAS